MTSNVIESETSNPLGESASHMAQKCLEFIEVYHKGSRTPLAKAAAIQDIMDTLTSGMPEQFSEAEVNDALKSYLKIIEQYDASIEAAAARTETADEPEAGSK